MSQLKPRKPRKPRNEAPHVLCCSLGLVYNDRAMQKMDNAEKLSFEHRLWSATPGLVLAGVDEAGRGPLAGPVAAGAVSMPQTLAEAQLAGPWAGLTDSKRLSETSRERFFEELRATPGVRIGLGWASAAEIDSLNILRATHLAMARAIAALGNPPPGFALVDGLPVHGLPCPHEAVVKGDAKCFFISAASIVAKVSRDRLMVELDAKYPGYGFADHKGYGTAEHLEALRRLGPCPEHRRSFGPVAEMVAPYHQGELF